MDVYVYVYVYKRAYEQLRMLFFSVHTIMLIKKDNEKGNMRRHL